MSFLPRFQSRWQTVLAPAVRAVHVDQVPLEPHRVDLRKASDSVLTEILQGISRSRFFIADITSMGELDGSPVRNGNVLYEVGLAHALRQPEEVLLLRSDSNPLLFDVANVRVISYDPDGVPDVARRVVTGAIVDSLRELDLRRAMAVRQAAESMDVHGWVVLFEAQGTDTIRHPPSRNMGEALAGAERRQAIYRLLSIGAIGAELVKFSADSVANLAAMPIEALAGYKITMFGRALVAYGREQLGITREIEELLGRATGGNTV